MKDFCAKPWSTPLLSVKAQVDRGGLAHPLSMSATLLSAPDPRQHALMAETGFRHLQLGVVRASFEEWRARQRGGRRKDILLRAVSDRLNFFFTRYQ